MNESRLKFQLTRRDLYDIIRITASQRPFRRVAMPALAGFVFLGHAIDGNYDKGLIWAVVVGALYWSISHFMFWLNVYGAGNQTLLAPQEIMDVKATDDYFVITTSTGKLVFLERSFEDPKDFQILKSWLLSVPPGRGGKH
jgi:hypothetical protein